MRENCRDFVKLFSEVFDAPEPIVEFGSRQVEGQGTFADLRPYFNQKKYIGCDYVQGPGVDMEENLTSLSFSEASVGTVLCIETMEHVENPFKAMNEIYRILKNDGLFVFTTPFNFPIHSYPYDYWRLTPMAWKVLMSKFYTTMIFCQGNKEFPHTVFGLAVKSPSNPFLTKEKMTHLNRKLFNSGLSQYQKGRLGSLISRFYDWKFHLRLNCCQWLRRSDISLEIFEG